jgi:hypothetical protein
MKNDGIAAIYEIRQGENTQTRPRKIAAREAGCEDTRKENCTGGETRFASEAAQKEFTSQVCTGRTASRASQTKFSCVDFRPRSGSQCG